MRPKYLSPGIQALRENAVLQPIEAEEQGTTLNNSDTDPSELKLEAETPINLDDFKETITLQNPEAPDYAEDLLILIDEYLDICDAVNDSDRYPGFRERLKDKLYAKAVCSFIAVNDEISTRQLLPLIKYPENLVTLFQMACHAQNEAAVEVMAVFDMGYSLEKSLQESKNYDQLARLNAIRYVVSINEYTSLDNLLKLSSIGYKLDNTSGLSMAVARKLLTDEVSFTAPEELFTKARYNFENTSVRDAVVLAQVLNDKCKYTENIKLFKSWFITTTRGRKILRQKLNIKDGELSVKGRKRPWENSNYTNEQSAVSDPEDNVKLNIRAKNAVIKLAQIINLNVKLPRPLFGDKDFKYFNESSKVPNQELTTLSDYFYKCVEDYISRDTKKFSDFSLVEKKRILSELLRASYVLVEKQVQKPNKTDQTVVNAKARFELLLSHSRIKNIGHIAINSFYYSKTLEHEDEIEENKIIEIIENIKSPLLRYRTVTTMLCELDSINPELHTNLRKKLIYFLNETNKIVQHPLAQRLLATTSVE